MLIDGSRIESSKIAMGNDRIELQSQRERPLSFDYIFEEMQKRFSQSPVVKHECHSCGASLEIDGNKHIFICKYCGATYAIGTSMVNSEV